MKFSCARNLVIITLTGLALTGCFDDTTEQATPTHDVEWFKTHDDERKATLTECSNNPGELKDTPNCTNAREAENQLASGSLRNIDW